MSSLQIPSTIRRLHVATGWFVLLLVCARPADAQVRHILLLQSLDRGNLTMDSFTATFRLAIEQHSTSPVTVMQCVVNPTGFDVSPEKPIVDYLMAAFADQPKPDLIVTVGGPAAVFAQKYSQQLFPGSALLFTSVDRRFLHGAALRPNQTAVASDNDMSLIVDDILQLFPQTSTVFMVMGSGPLGNFWRRVMEPDFQRFRGRVAFIWSDDLSFADILQRVAALPPQSAIFFLTFGTDAQGGTYPEDRVLAQIHAAANAPLFGALGAQLGHGIVGGMLTDTDRQARTAADVALRILNGESPERIRPPAQKPGPRVFDWRELQRWRIPDSRLPSGSAIRFQEPGIWARFKWIIVTAASALLVQALLIGALLVNRAKRERAEQSLRENVAELNAARGALSHLSGRLMEAQEQERTRLARELHDDVGQRMSFVAMDMARLRDQLPDAAGDTQEHARQLHDAVIALGHDVQDISHRLHSSKIELLGLAAAAGSFCREASNRHNLSIEYTHENVPSGLADSVAISLFRVLQEAVSNAAKHSGAERCKVKLQAANGTLTLEVSDDGRGFETGAALRGHGLGLMSMQERLKLVNGDVSIRSKVGVGTTIRATVPLTIHDAVQTQAS